MSLSQYTSDGTEIAGVLIDVMHGRLDGTRISHRLTAARLLTIYGHKDADDFIIDNMPEVSDEKWGQRVRVEIDSKIASYIKQTPDVGHEICQFLIDVVKGKIEGIHVGHRVWAAKELLNRAYGKSQSRPLPKHPGSKTPRRSTNGTHRKRPQTPEAAADVSPNASPQAERPSQDPLTSRSRLHLRLSPLALQRLFPSWKRSGSIG